MGRERWFRGDHEGRERPFDWSTLARERDIPMEQARALYEEALRQARESRPHHRGAEDIYLALLEAARPQAWRPSPGKVTRTMRLAAARAGKRRGQGAVAPGKRTLTSYLAPPARGQHAEPPGMAAGTGPLPSDAMSGTGPLPSDAMSGTGPPARERPRPGTIAYRWQQANLLAAHGHFEALDALEEELLAAEPDAHGHFEALDALEEELLAAEPDTAAPRSGDSERSDIPQPLPATTRARMEHAFGQSFADVIVYPESPAATGATRALAREREIHFRGDSYAPGTARGDWLIAHELAHVVQQTGTRGPHAPPSVLETEADRAAGAVLAGRRAAVSLGASPGAVQAFSDAEEHDVDLSGLSGLPDIEALDAGAAAETAMEAGAEAAGATAAGVPEASAAEAAQAAQAAQTIEETEEPGDPEPIDLGALARELAAGGPEVDAAPAPAGLGGGAAAPAPEGLEAEAPDVSQTPPEQGLAALAGVRPDRLAGALGGVRSAASSEVAEDRDALAQEPPQQMSTGEEAPEEDAAQGEAGEAALAVDPDAGVAAAGQDALDALEQAAGEAAEAPAAVTAPLPVDAILAPAVADAPPGEGEAAGGMSDADVARMTDALDALPTSDPHASTDPGPAPELDVIELASESAEARRDALDASVTQAEDLAAIHIAQPMGEDGIAPTLAPEVLTASLDEVAAGADAEAGAALAEAAAAVQAAGAGALGDAEAAGIIAHLEQRAEIDAALAEAQARMAAERQAHAEAEDEQRARAEDEIAAIRDQAEADQAAARDEARAQVEQARADWQAEVDEQAAAARAEAEAEVRAGMADIEAEQARANAEAERHLDEGRAQAEDEQRQSEEEAERIKEEKEEESGGFFGWLASQAQSFFDSVKQAISDVLDAARLAIQRVIQAARDLAVAAIDAARQVIVDTIRAVGEALIAIGDLLLAAFPALRERFRATIQGLVDSAVEAVDRIAEGLKDGVQAALDLLAQGLDAALRLLERGLHAIVDGVSAAVQGAIQFAEGVVQAFGLFAVLIQDVAADPGGWLGLLGAAVVDGIQNHLWDALQAAVLGWFQDKVLELLGIGGIVLQLLMDDGIDLAQITGMAWEALQAAIPAALLAILIERLVSMIVPAAGAVLMILEGLQAAWGAVSRIIAAVNAFIAFLQAVKGGAAGPQFANLLALSAVVVIDFVSNWLLRRLMRAARRVGQRLRQMAERFRERRRRRRERDRRRDRERRDRDGREDGDDTRRRDRAETREQARQRQVQERVDLVRRELPPKIAGLLARKPSKLRVRAQLALWRAQYRLRRLEMQERGGKHDFIAQVNPTIDLADGWSFEDRMLFRVIDELAGEYMGSAQAARGNTPDVRGGVEGPISLNLAEPATPTVALQNGQSYLIGTTESGNPVGYDHRLASGWGRGMGWQEIAGLAASRGHRYDDLKTALANVDVGAIFTNLWRGQPIPDLPQQGAIEELFGLWFAKESSHPRGTHGHRRDLVYSFMLAQLMAPENGADRLDVSQAIDLHPAAFGGAQPGARQLTAEMLDPNASVPGANTKLDQERAERYRREVDSIKAWFRRHQSELPMLGRTPTIEDVREFVRAQLRKYFQGGNTW